MNEPLVEHRLQAWVGRDGRPHPLVYHEAAHALVGYRLGMRVEHVDMSGADAPCPSCGLDEANVPAEQRARAVGVAALAGPVAESLADGEPPRWREDGQIAMEAARTLAQDTAGQVELVLEWRREVRRLLKADPAFEPLAARLGACERLTGEEFESLVQEVDVMNYPLTQHEGHLLVTVDGQIHLVDTGAPWSLGAAPLTLGGREFAVQAQDLMGNTAASLSDMVGTHIDGLIGTDVLGAFDVEISLRDGRLTVSEALLPMDEGVRAEGVEGVPLIECEVGGEPLRMFFDTGAPLSYVSEEHVQGTLSLGEVEDFHPLMGRFTVPTHAVEVCAWGRPMQIRAGRMPMLLEAALGLAGAQGILGTEVLRHGVLRWSSRQQRMALVAH